MAPLEDELKQRGIDTHGYSMDNGLRALPLAALHDGKQFLVEKYNLTLIPSANLLDTRYIDLRPRQVQVLAMGLSQAVQGQTALPGVPAELTDIFQGQLWGGVKFLNEGVTFENLKRQRDLKPYGIIHLATHGEFEGGPNDSFIQLWDTKMKLAQVRSLGWNDPPVELLVLSACRTALGSDSAELGFGGLSIQAGVRTAVASLWSINDEATLTLMRSFYEQLGRVPIKAEALREAQITMLRSGKFTHPYFWSAFTAIGSPW